MHNHQMRPLLQVKMLDELQDFPIMVNLDVGYVGVRNTGHGSTMMDRWLLRIRSQDPPVSQTSIGA